MIDKLRAIHDRYHVLEEQMSDPNVVNDTQRYARVSKDYKDIQPVVAAYLQYVSIEEQIASAKSVLAEDADPDMREMARDEIHDLQQALEQLTEDVRLLLIPKDEEDGKDVLFEVRAGTGGDEAAIFAGDLFRMYTRYFDSQGWKYELMEETESAAGGYSKISLEVKGEEVYGKMKFESGTHRVQRVPETESKGRVHTSAATVAVIPKLEMEDVNINKADLKTDTFRASGAGGQHVNKTESGVRFTHLPTGVVAESTEARSQHQNREIALQRLYQRIVEIQRKEHDTALADQRRSLVGSGDRSEKIRTYNYPQNRLTDHRINLTLYSLDRVMEGEIQGVIDALIMHDNMEKMQIEGL